MAKRLQMLPEEWREFAAAALETVLAYQESLRERAIMPQTSSEDLRRALGEPAPRAGSGFAGLLEIFRETIVPKSRQNGHPRFFGYVASPASPAAVLGNFLAAALNSNVTSWRSAPAAAELEHVTVNWLKEMVGFPEEGLGLFVSGGSMANFSALAAARSARYPGDVSRNGLQAGGKILRVYVSEEGHSSIGKAAALLGLGEDNVQRIPTDDRFRIDAAALERRIQGDLAAGYLPACVVANAGTVATGAVDPMDEVAEIARRYGLWMHVDGAYGALAAIVPSVRGLFSGMSRADSLTLDPHKWLYASMGCGCILYRDPGAARSAFSHDADYLRVIGFERDEAFAFWDYGPELSRRFRALPVWMLIKYAGTDCLAESIEGNIRCAKHVEALVQESEDFEMLAPAELSIFCFRYSPRGFEGDLDALNEQLLVELQRGGHSYLSNARLRGRFALRGCVLNYATTPGDMEILLADVREAGRRVVQR